MTANSNAFNHATKALELIPPHVSGAVLMRHAERDEFAVGHHGNDILLTAQGEQDALNMGELMKGRISALLHSPVPRCLQTAEQIRIGDDSKIHVFEWMALRCDIFVDNFDFALDTLKRLVSEKEFYDIFVNQMSTCGVNIPYSHFRPPLIAAADMIRYMLNFNEQGNFRIGITHDWLVNVVSSYAIGKPIKRENYAGFLDALFVWEEKEILMFYYKGEIGKCSSLFADAI